MVKDRGVWDWEAPLGEALGGGRRGGFRVRWGRRVMGRGRGRGRVRLLVGGGWWGWRRRRWSGERREWERGSVGGGGADNGLGAVAKEAAGEEWARRGLELWVLRFHGDFLKSKESGECREGEER